MEIRKIRNTKGSFLSHGDLESLRTEIENELKAIGFNSFVSIVTKGAIRISNVRLDKLRWNLNLSPYTSRRGAVLNFKQWELINHVINVILDSKQYRANAESLNGLFVIRKGTTAFTDYEDRAYDNIGSQIKPVYRLDAWQPEDEINFKHARTQAIEHIINRYPVLQYFKNYAREA